MIEGPGEGARGAGEAAAVLNGFEGVEIDAEAAAAIAAALEACAARAREAELAAEKGGDVAAEIAADDPSESFVRIGDAGNPYLGELLPALSVEEYVPFVEGEGPWAMTGADKSEALIAWQEELQRRALTGESGKRRSGRASRPSQGS